MSLNVLVIMGSPRNSGDTRTALNSFLSGVKQAQVVDVRLVDVCKLNINPCIGCLKCAETGNCIYADDMTELYEEFAWADAVVVGSPLYFNSVTAQLKAMIDRCQVYWSRKFKLKTPVPAEKKNGAFICVGGVQQGEEGFAGANMVMDLFFKSIASHMNTCAVFGGTDDAPVQERPDVMEWFENEGKTFGRMIRRV